MVHNEVVRFFIVTFFMAHGVYVRPCNFALFKLDSRAWASSALYIVWCIPV